MYIRYHSLSIYVSFYEFQLLVTMICYNNNINSNICKIYLKIKKDSYEDNCL